MQTEDILRLDRQAARMWPAETSEPWNEWLLRANPDLPSKRANSVLALGPMPGSPFWLDDIAEFYARFGLPPRFHVSTAAPSGLDRLLEREGFIVETPSWVMTASCRDVRVRSGSAEGGGYEVRVFPLVHSDWTDAFIRIEGFDPKRKEAYQAMLDRIQPSKAFIAVEHEGETVGIGTAVSENGWTGLINIASDERYRRRGIGTKIVCGLAEWSMRHGADRLYLQVVADNEPAKRLYGKLGFRRAFGYHYRCQYK